MKKILISGYYGFGNIGDEAILGAMISEFKKTNNVTDITVLSNNPEQTEEDFNINSVNRSSIVKVIKSILLHHPGLHDGGTDRGGLWSPPSRRRLAAMEPGRLPATGTVGGAALRSSHQYPVQPRDLGLLRRHAAGGAAPSPRTVRVRPRGGHQAGVLLLHGAARHRDGDDRARGSRDGRWGHAAGTFRGFRGHGHGSNGDADLGPSDVHSSGVYRPNLY